MAKSKKQIKVKGTGLGDVIEKVIKATHLDIFVEGKDCGCDKRKEKLNQLFSTKITANCMNESQYNIWTDYLKRKSSIKVEDNDIKMISTMYADLFNRLYYEPCRNCSPKPLISMIEKIQLVYDSYGKE